jgi:geranylgeranyl diphosphate synthase type I
MTVTIQPEPFPPLEETLEAYKLQLECLRARVQERVIAGPHGQAMSSFVVAGKLIRPLVTFAAAEASGGLPASAMPAAEAIELLHAGSLVHDDIMDEAETRRGEVAIHRRHGSGAAIVIGDSLILAAFSALAATPGLPDSRLRLAMLELGEHGQACCQGQLRELEEHPVDPHSDAAYIMIAAQKTGRLFMAASALGALLGGGRLDHVRALRQYGRHLGIAFQIRDDVLDVDEDVRFSRFDSGTVKMGSRAQKMLLANDQASRAVGAIESLPGRRGVAHLELIARHAVERGE